MSPPAWWLQKYRRSRPRARPPHVCECGAPIINPRARCCRACYLGKRASKRQAWAALKASFPLALALLLAGCVMIRDSHVTIDREFSIRREVPAREPAHRHGPQAP